MVFKKPIVTISIFLILVLLTAVPYPGTANGKKPDAVSSATQLAVKRALPANFSFNAAGMVKHPCTYSKKNLEQFPFIRIRSAEVKANGEILGAYIYTGIPVLYLLEKTVPLKPKDAVFNRPLDMQVVFRSSTGKEKIFSYCELTMVNDNNPVILAFHREPLRPSKPMKHYGKNKFTGKLKGFRLICPGDKDNNRYLEDVKEFSLRLPTYPEKLLPKVQKGMKCASSTITVIDKNDKNANNGNNGKYKPKKAALKNVPRKKITDWVRIGHGRGLKGDKPAVATGFHLPSFLRENFANTGSSDFFLIVGCDGYRALLSGREIFDTKTGDSFVIMDSLNGKKTKEGFTLATPADFFIDRCVKGVSHIVRL